MKQRCRSIKRTVWWLTIKGMAYYGVQLTAVELLTIAAIYSIRDIIDFLNTRDTSSFGYALFLFLVFASTRFGAILIRNFFDLHVYNYFRFVRTAIQGWVLQDIVNLPVWAQIGESEGSGSDE